MKRTFKCIKPYTAKSFPEDLHVERGEILTLEGFLMGQHPVFNLDPKRHPSPDKHLTHCSFVVFSGMEGHFKEVI